MRNTQLNHKSVWLEMLLAYSSVVYLNYNEVVVWLVLVGKEWYASGDCMHYITAIQMS